MVTLLRALMRDPLFFMVSAAALTGSIPVLLRQIGSRTVKTAAWWMLCGGWAVAAITITLRPLPVIEPASSVELVPVLPLVADLNAVGISLLLGNILLFGPLGSLLNTRRVRLAATIMLSCLTSVTVEVLQFTQAAGRQSDVNDVLLNVMGAVFGYSLAEFLERDVYAGTVPRTSGA